MRPLHLDIKAFGPYADHQAIDFSELRDYRFFLIHGPTGSGKTALLDAMCYALYGDTSGGPGGKARSGENMRSDYASDTEITEVTFDFAVGQSLYRVRRSPRQWVARKRGSGLTETGESACLFRIDADRQEVAALAEKSQKVTAEVQRILGFRSDQFRQVVLLPQGDFRRLLLADSGERQEIMQTLFQTGYYSDVELRLKEAAKTWAERYAETDAKMQELQTLAGVGSMSELQERTDADERKAGTLQTQIAEATEAVTTARGLLSDAQRDRQTLDEHQAATLAFEALQREADAMLAKRLELQSALRAAEANESVAVAQERKREREKAFILRQEAEAVLASATERHETANREWESIQAREPELAGWLLEKNRLEEIRRKSAALTESIFEARRYRQEAEDAAEGLKKTEEELETLQNDMLDFQAREAVARILAAETPGREAAFRQWQIVQERRKKLDRLCSELQTSENKLSTAVTAAKTSQACWEAELGQLEILQGKWEHEQAALLAAGLEDGQPCPVCGSTGHPVKALPAGDAPDPSAVKRQKLKVEECVKEKDEARQQEFEVQGERDRLAHSTHVLIEELGEYSQWLLPRLDQAMSEARQSWEDAARAQMEVGRLRQQGEILLSRLDAAKADRVQREQHRTATEAKARAAEAVATERQVMVPTEYRNIKTLELAITSIQERITALQNLMEKSRRSAAETGNMLARARAQHDERNGVAERAEDAWTQSETEKRMRMIEAGFADEKEYFSAARNVEARRNLYNLIRDFDGRMAAARERLDRATKAALRITGTPDIASLETSYKMANELEQELRVEEGRVLDRLKQARGLITRFVELHKARKDAEEQHSLYAGLHEIAAGRFTGVSFERYVLGFLLDEVSIYANLRLKEMTRGRYRLRRRENREDKRKGAGLDLEVLDGFTGEARPVQTLSGGETFLASLALAFGLADVVQSRSGGIHLETLFVDEGFGTLDPETLDLAIKALQDLQQGGRLVGIISHVPELRERIDARLEVIPGTRGSYAEFHVG